MGETLCTAVCILVPQNRVDRLFSEFSLKLIRPRSKENKLLSTYYVLHTVLGTLKKLFNPPYNPMKCYKFSNFA